MKNKLNYLKKLIKVIIWPIIFIIGQFFIEYFFVAYYNMKNKGNLSNNEFLEFIKTIEYKNSLNNFINSKLLIITVISFVIFLPIFYFKYKKYKTVSKKHYMLESILYGISISLIYNIIIYNLNDIFNFTDRYKASLPFIVVIICTGILGPILEEILFRGIVYNRLKSFNSNMKSIILTSLIFSIFHFDIINSIYAFFTSFILIYLYEKYNTLYAPILMHIFLNSTILFVIKFDLLSIKILNITLFIVSILILLILYIKNRRVYETSNRNNR